MDLRGWTGESASHRILMISSRRASGRGKGREERGTGIVGGYQKMLEGNNALFRLAGDTPVAESGGNETRSDLMIRIIDHGP